MILNIKYKYVTGSTKIYIFVERKTKKRNRVSINSPTLVSRLSIKAHHPNPKILNGVDAVIMCDGCIGPYPRIFQRCFLKFRWLKRTIKWQTSVDVCQWLFRMLMLCFAGFANGFWIIIWCCAWAEHASYIVYVLVSNTLTAQWFSIERCM